MKIKPIVFKQIQTKHTSIEVDFMFDPNITFVTGDAGTGKSLVFTFLREMSAENKNIKCFNYLDKAKNYKTAIKQSKGKLIIIDNADLLLDDAMRQYIAMDDKNQYIIIGRNPTGLELTQDEINELKSENRDGKTMFTLVKVFECHAGTVNSEPSSISGFCG